MLSKKMEAALNAQVNAEFWSAYLYLSMSTNFSALGNPGFANWFAVQFKEEQDHAMIFVKYILSRGGKVSLAPIDKVQTEWASPLAAFEDTLTHEKKVTAMIHDLYTLADAEKDYATKSMLGWFIDEQVDRDSGNRDVPRSTSIIEKTERHSYIRKPPRKSDFPPYCFRRTATVGTTGYHFEKRNAKPI